LQPGTYILKCMCSYGDGWHGGYITIQSSMYCSSFSSGSLYTEVISIAGEATTVTTTTPTNECPPGPMPLTGEGGCSDSNKCTAFQFCNFDYGDSGFCQPCNLDDANTGTDYVHHSCTTDYGLPAAGSQDCMANCGAQCVVH
jgi:hypothetical protein